ncbi:MAG: hypothetical protein H0U69_15545 [Trueperaceae bacterium]|nr:hypothetical protein [Trueperaceae bacterium]
MPHRPPTITFVELAGPDASERLAHLHDTLATPGTPGELLQSLERDDLWLLVLRGVEPAEEVVPEGARIWRFAAPKERA